MVYYKATNQFIWFTTNPQTGLDGLLTDLHIGLNCLLQIHKPVYQVYYKSTNRFRWFTNRFLYRFKSFTAVPQTGLDGLLTDLHTGLNGLLTDIHTGLNALLQNHEPVFLVY